MQVAHVRNAIRLEALPNLLQPSVMKHSSVKVAGLQTSAEAPIRADASKQRLSADCDLGMYLVDGHNLREEPLLHAGIFFISYLS
jgi:hypothetical protein